MKKRPIRAENPRMYVSTPPPPTLSVQTESEPAKEFWYQSRTA